MHVSKKGDHIARKVLSVFALLLITGTMWAQNIKVTGVVTDDKGEPIIGASILIQGTRTGEAADLDGKFTMNVPGNAVLEISAIGYEKQTIQLRNRTSLKIVLREDAVLLEETEIVGEFGVKRASRAVGGAVESVRGAEIAESGRENFVTALQGRVAVSVRISTLWRSDFSFSFCFTPKRCSSSITTSPRSRNSTSLWNNRWVPIIISTSPALSAFRVAFCSAGVLKREIIPRRIPKDSMRFLND